jgi:hypothetical protein
MAAKKWDMAAAVASHLAKVQPENAGWWISLAYAVTRTESVEKAEAILFRAQAIHPKVAVTAFNLACYKSVTGRVRTRELVCGVRSSLIKTFANWRSTMRICDLCGIGLFTCISHPEDGENCPAAFPLRLLHGMNQF